MPENGIFPLGARSAGERQADESAHEKQGRSRLGDDRGDGQARCALLRDEGRGAVLGERRERVLNGVGVDALQEPVGGDAGLPHELRVDEDVLGSVVRYRRDIGENSTLGFLYAGREGTDYHNRVAGVDGFLRLSETDTVNFQYMRSNTLYDEDFATFEADEVYDQSDATGFIRLNALRLRIRALRDQKKGL